MSKQATNRRARPAGRVNEGHHRRRATASPAGCGPGQGRRRGDRAARAGRGTTEHSGPIGIAPAISRRRRSAVARRPSLVGFRWSARPIRRGPPRRRPAQRAGLPRERRSRHRSGCRFGSRGRGSGRPTRANPARRRRDGAPADDSPFVAPVLSAELIGEAAALAAEAAAVRALDSGPLTPPPQLLGVVATPSPGAPRTDVDADDLPTPPPSTAEALAAPPSGLSSAVPFLDGERTPPRSVAARLPRRAGPYASAVRDGTADASSGPGGHPGAARRGLPRGGDPDPAPRDRSGAPASGVELAPTDAPLTGSTPRPPAPRWRSPTGSPRPNRRLRVPAARHPDSGDGRTARGRRGARRRGRSGGDLAEVTPRPRDHRRRGPVSEATPPPKRVPTRRT